MLPFAHAPVSGAGASVAASKSTAATPTVTFTLGGTAVRHCGDARRGRATGSTSSKQGPVLSYRAPCASHLGRIVMHEPSFRVERPEARLSAAGGSDDVACAGMVSNPLCSGT